MTPAAKKKLILSLIKDNLINAKLVNGLNALGLNTGSYFLHLGSTIFELMGYEDNKHSDAVYEHYLKLSEKAGYIDISKGDHAMDPLAMEIYVMLVKRRIVTNN